MADEKNIPGYAPGEKEEATTGSEPITETPADDYYLVDDPKKEVLSTIGDGEMHNEGLVGEGDIPEGGLFAPGTAEDQQETE